MNKIFEPEYDIDPDGVCPKCGHSPTHSRQCLNFCDDGWFDCAYEDPINYAPGEEDEICTECWGTGVEIWCPKCGLNIQRYNYAKEKSQQSDTAWTCMKCGHSHSAQFDKCPKPLHG